MPLPDTLARKIELYRERGLLLKYDSESFFEPSWLCMFGNLGIDAGAGDPLSALLPLPELEDVTRRVRADIARIASGATPHREFLKIAGALA
jgi:tryptophan halogenase